MSRLLAVIVALALSVLPLVGGVSASCDASTVALSLKNVPCAASEEICRGWRAFRDTHPFPYQSIAVSLDSGGNTLVILSEVPPIAPPTEVAALAEKVFEGYHPSIHRLRYPIGHDGWLEDIVLSISGDHGPKVSVPTSDATSIDLPHGIANRLQYLYAALFGTSKSFYVDRVNPSAILVPSTLDELQVTAGDLRRLVGDPLRKWHSLAREGPAIGWAEVESSASVGTFVDDSAAVVVLAVPPQTTIESLRGEFRDFAVSSDYLIGALRPKRGGLMLFARNRQIPLNVLPPLRFETVASLAGKLGQPLGQSYERQRVLAGKIRFGELANWDWAPIYLSPQLEDSEFGTLLNLADQQLKSWSERGDVRYARFTYPDPKSYPFDETATKWFFLETLSTSLIFNWNTSGFSTAVDQGAVGRVISAASTTALPVSYIPPMKDESGILQLLRARLEVDARQRSIEASAIGSHYFAGLGDPILARVVQNVFLYQVLSETRPFTTTTESANQTKRSSAVTKILIDETSRWLREATEPGPQQNAELVRLVTASSMTIPKLALLLAAPDLSTRSLIRANSAAELYSETYKRAFAEYDAKLSEGKLIEERRRAEFVQRCNEIGGAIKLSDDGMTCHYTTENGTKATFPTKYDAKYEALIGELNSLEQTLKEAKAGYEKAADTLQRLVTEQTMAQRVADDLRSRASRADDLDAVLESVLKATSAIPSESSIQTPSVVLSCNTRNQGAVGGHNIDALPWLAKEGSAKGRAVVRSASERPTVLMPKDQLGQSTQIARGVIERTDNAAIRTRPLDEALGLPRDRTNGSFLELLQTRPHLPVADRALIDRASHCHCDLYVERAQGDIAMVVSLGPPPKPYTIFGSSQLAEKLAETKSSRVLFAGFAEDQVSSVARNAAQRAEILGRQKSGFLEEAIHRAKALFHEGVDTARAVFELPTKSRKRAMAALAPDLPPNLEVLTTMLSARPVWKQAEVRAGADAPASLVEVVFPAGKRPEGDALKSIEIQIRPLNAKGELVKRVELASAAKASVRTLADSNRTVESAITALADRLHRDAGVEEVKFFMRNIGSERIVRLNREHNEWVTSEVLVGE